MKAHIIAKAGIILALITLLGVVPGCDSDSKSSEALLSGITFRGKAPDTIPLPLSKAEWNNDETFYDIFNQDHTTTIYFALETDLINLPVSAQASGGAKVEYGIMIGDRPTSFSTASPKVISPSQALIVRVTSGNGSAVNYYRFLFLMMSSDSQLSSLTIAGVSPTTLGNSAPNWNLITNAGKISLSNALKNNAEVVGTPSASGASIEYALGLSGSAPAYSSATVYDFTDGASLYVKVTAENGENFSVYRIDVQIGRDATLSGVTIGGVAAVLGTPKTSWGTYSASQRGSCQPDDRMPAAGFAVVITTNDEEATVQWLADVPTSGYPAATPPDSALQTYSGEIPFKFPSDQSDIIIKVTAANKVAVNYYRIRLITKSWTAIYKGTPDIGTNGAPVIDAIWDNEEWIVINRFNRAETWKAFFEIEGNAHTSAKVKLLWDDDGLWTYWDIDYHDYKDNNNVDQVRKTVRSGEGSVSTEGAHERDTVELFINERWQAQKTGNYGNQYRGSADNKWLSGLAGNAMSGTNPISLFTSSGKTRAWIKMDGEKEIGYVVIMQGPWTHKTNPEANKVFGTDEKVLPNAEIGLELQVNACDMASGGRDAILTWNGVTSVAYQNVRSYGIATLETRD